MLNRISWERLIDWFQRTPPARFVVWTAAGIIIWNFSSKAVSDILVYGAFLFALTRAARGAAAWKQPAGIAFIVILIYVACTLPFSANPGLSLHDFKDMLKILAGAFAIPVIFNTRAKIEAALFYSATAITCVLGYDLIRLTIFLGPNLLVQAHIFKPFIFNHSNVASMMAGAAIFVFFQRGLYIIAERNGCPASGIRLQSSPVRHPSSIFSGLPSGVCRLMSVSGCLLGALICLAHMVMMASRGPQIAFVLAAGIAGLLIPSRSGKLLWFLIVVLAAGALIMNIEHVNPRFLEKKSMSNFSERDKVWQHTWNLSAQHPWFGYGYGKRNFEMVYYNTQPPKSRFHYPHPHQFWLKLLFEFGWTGLALHLAAWLILGISLARYVWRQPTFAERLLPGTVGLIFCFIHLYGLGDYPDNIVLVAQFWLIPAALVLMSPQAPLTATKRM